MKHFLMSAFLILNLLSLTARAQTVTREDLRRTVVHMQQLAREMQSELDAATVAKLALSNQITALEATLSEAQARADTLQAQLDEQTRLQAEKLNAAIAAAAQAESQRDRARADLTHVLGKYHFLKLLGASLCAGLVFLLVWRFSPALAGPWALVVYLIPPAAAFAAFCSLL